jgi:hypothetical protein
MSDVWSECLTAEREAARWREAAPIDRNRMSAPVEIVSVQVVLTGDLDGAELAVDLQASNVEASAAYFTVETLTFTDAGEAVQWFGAAADKAVAVDLFRYLRLRVNESLGTAPTGILVQAYLCGTAS